MEVEIDWEKVERLSAILDGVELPGEEESGDHTDEYSLTNDDLANAYFAIVAICHQTSPMGEPRLRGRVNEEVKAGWNYLKEAFLLHAENNRKICDPDFWLDISPKKLSNLYEDEEYGKTLSRINERAYLIRDCGEFLKSRNERYVKEILKEADNNATGDNGFLKIISKTVAYSDPLHKKGVFFLSIASKECGWRISDEKQIPSPIDYHELRGHLRIGTVQINNKKYEERLKEGLPISEKEDIRIRESVQKVITKIAKKIGENPTRIHYLLWNVFRECCPRESQKTHCSKCENCGLPNRYKNLKIYNGNCIFEGVCRSAGEKNKLKEPAYTGHFY